MIIILVKMYQLLVLLCNFKLLCMVKEKRKTSHITVMRSVQLMKS